MVAFIAGFLIGWVCASVMIPGLQMPLPLEIAVVALCPAVFVSLLWYSYNLIPILNAVWYAALVMGFNRWRSR
jgi:hypothetical protein